MPQSLSKIYLHIIFHVKTTSPTIRPDDLERMHAYIGQLVNATGCTNIWTGGVEDHIHCLCQLSRKETVAHLVEEMKRNSSRWIKTLATYYASFEWQGGYGVFSVSQSVVESTLSYIKNQREHHRKISFQEEYRNLLELYHIDYNEEYVFSD